MKLTQFHSKIQEEEPEKGKTSAIIGRSKVQQSHPDEKKEEPKTHLSLDKFFFYIMLNNIASSNW